MVYDQDHRMGISFINAETNLSSLLQIQVISESQRSLNSFCVLIGSLIK